MKNIEPENFRFDLYFEPDPGGYVYYHDIDEIMEWNGYDNQKLKRRFTAALKEKFGCTTGARSYRESFGVYYNRRVYYNIKIKERF